MDFSELARLAAGHAEARIVQVAVAIKLFDALEGDGRSAPSLAAALDTDARATKLLLNALVSFGLLGKHGDRFTLTRISSEFLVTKSPRYYGHMICFDAALWESWGALEWAVRHGVPVRTPDMYQGDAQETERFILAMDSLVNARGDAEIVGNWLNLTGVKEILDLGPGPATYAIQWCRMYPDLHVTLFDLPETLKVTEKLIQGAGMVDRVQLIRGDYQTDSIPGPYPMIFMSNIIHSEGVEENRRLMAKLYAALDTGGRLVIKDHILNGDLTEPSVGAAFSLLMLLTTRHGRCYSLAEVEDWLKASGFDSTHHVSLPKPLTSSMVVGEKR